MEEDIISGMIPLIDMDNPNQNIKIYSGQLCLARGEDIVHMTGEVYFTWFPFPSVKVKGITEDDKSFELFHTENNIKLLKEKIPIGEFGITNISKEKSSKQIQIQGIMLSELVIGYKSITVNQFRFSIPNLRDYWGYEILTGENTDLKSMLGRIVIETKSFKITLDKISGFSERIKALKDTGGYHLLYTGEIRFDKPTTYEKLIDIRKCLNNFFTFVNGNKISLLFFVALHFEETIYSEYSPQINYSFVNCNSWSINIDPNISLNDLFNSFYEHWFEIEDNKFLLTSLCHWYSEANINSGYCEGSIIFAQAALELLYNWIVVETFGSIVGKDAEDISASNKIRILISKINVTKEIPEKFKFLIEFVKNETHKDGPEAIVQIRNAIVHSQKGKRKKIMEIQPECLKEALELCLYYIELSILFKLNYKKYFNNRCTGDFELVPWA